jgi:protein-disulfide isomerase
VKRQVLPDERVQAALDNYIPVQLNLGKHIELARRYGVTGAPAFVVLNSGGQLVSVQDGYVGAELFTQFLQSASAAISAGS